MSAELQVRVTFASGAVALFGVRARRSRQAYRKMYARVSQFPDPRGALLSVTRIGPRHARGARPS